MSGRIRTVKPEWLEDEKLAQLDDGARVLSIGLMLLADDHGRGRAHPLYIASRVWGYGDSHETLTKVSDALNALSRVGFVKLYSVGGQRYFAITNWAKHQKVQHVGKPRVPGPDDPESTPDPAPESPPLPTLTKPSGDSHEVLTPDLRPHTTDLIPPSIVAPPAPLALKREDRHRVFEHWRALFGKGRAKLDKQRAGLIDRAIDAYGLEAVLRCLDGYATSDWHTGKDPKTNGKRYDGLGLLLRNGEHIETGIELATKNAPTISPALQSAWADEMLRLQKQAGELRLRRQPEEAARVEQRRIAIESLGPERWAQSRRAANGARAAGAHGADRPLSLVARSAVAGGKDAAS